MCWRTCSRASGSSCLSSSISCEASYTAHGHQQVYSKQLGGATDSEAATDTTGLLEQIVRRAEAILVYFDFAAVFENDCKVISIRPR